MKTGFIVIGDEILSGATNDANTPWLASFLSGGGARLDGVTVVPDDVGAIRDALHFMFAKADVVLTSGGLGPTLDDMTKKAVATFFGVALRADEGAAATTKKNYAMRSVPWYPESSGYHIVPEGALALANPKGLAPGLVVRRRGKTLLCAPGVPLEFQRMVEAEFWSLVGRPSPEGFLRRVVVRTSQVGEERLFSELAPDLWGRLSELGKVASLPRTTGVDIVVSFEADGPEADRRERAVRAIVEGSAIGGYVWAWRDVGIGGIVVEEARNRGFTFSFAESCTGGLCASLVTDVPGSSAVFLGSFVTYANELKTGLLGVELRSIESHGAVSVEVADAMAQGARMRSGSDIAVSLSGIAGPDGASRGKPVGTLALSVATAAGSVGRIHHFSGDRKKLKRLFAQQALVLLLKTIRGL